MTAVKLDTGILSCGTNYKSLIVSATGQYACTLES